MVGTVAGPAVDTLEAWEWGTGHMAHTIADVGACARVHSRKPGKPSYHEMMEFLLMVCGSSEVLPRPAASRRTQGEVYSAEHRAMRDDGQQSLANRRSVNFFTRIECKRAACD